MNLLLNFLANTWMNNTFQEIPGLDMRFALAPDESAQFVSGDFPRAVQNIPAKVFYKLLFHLGMPQHGMSNSVSINPGERPVVGHPRSHRTFPGPDSPHNSDNGKQRCFWKLPLLPVHGNGADGTGRSVNSL
ncbi:MAG: hypothetical protein R3C12_01995 [Planctomycetaceae bacterium]